MRPAITVPSSSPLVPGRDVVEWVRSRRRCDESRGMGRAHQALSRPMTARTGCVEGAGCPSLSLAAAGRRGRGSVFRV